MSTVKADKITYGKGGYEHDVERQLIAGFVTWDSTTIPPTPLESYNLTTITDNAVGIIFFNPTNTYLETENIIATGACSTEATDALNARTCNPYTRNTTVTRVTTGDNNTDTLVDVLFASLYQYGAYA